MTILVCALYISLIAALIAFSSSTGEQYVDHVSERAIKDLEFLEEGDNDTVFSQEIFTDILDSECGMMMNKSLLNGHYVLMLGSGEYPRTLVVSLEKKTDVFVYQFIHDWCRSSDTTISSILSHSTMLFLVDTEIPKRTQCGEYYTIPEDMESVIADLSLLLRFDVVLMIGSGGIKLRYAQHRNGLGEPLALRYQENHSYMSGLYSEICAGHVGGFKNNADDTLIRQMSWGKGISDHPDVIVKQMNGLLVQVACCYEALDYSHMYAENRQALIDTMSLRTTGVHIEAEEEIIVINDLGMPHLRLREGQQGFMALPPQDVSLQIIRSDGDFIAEFNVSLSSEHPFERLSLKNVTE